MKGSLPFKDNKVYYESTGEGTPIVWIHGGGVDHRMWNSQKEYFAKTNRVILYDLRGHGQSTFSDNSVPDIGDLEFLLDSLDLKQVYLAGLSLGAIIAVDFVLAHPERVKKLILLSPGLIGVQEKQESYLKAVMAIGQALQSSDREGAVQAILNMTFHNFPATNPPATDQMVGYVREAASAYVESGSYLRLPQLQETVPLSRLPEIEQPTLIIHGGKDLDYMKENVAALLEHLPDARNIEYEQAAHLVNWEMATEVNKAIDAFLK